MEFVIAGQTKKSKEELTSFVQKHGGKIATKIHSGTAAVISNPTELEKMRSRIQAAQEMDIQVITEDFFDEILNGCDVIELLKTKNISSWGGDPLLRFTQEDEDIKAKESRYTKNVPTKMLLKLKEGNAVDPDSELDDVAHIYKTKEHSYNCVLTLTDIQSGKNSYYKLQLLEADKKNRYWVFRAWGRIGTTIGGTKVNDCREGLDEALEVFKRIYKDQTGNQFGKPFVKVPGRYCPIEIDYSSNKEKNINDVSKIPSKLDNSVQNLIKLLFDIDQMKKQLLEFELDMVKMPLGKLSSKQIESAYTVLNKLSLLIASGGSQQEFIGLSNQFFTLVPHSYGIELPPVLDTVDLIKHMTEVLDSLMEIELAYTLLNADVDDSINPVDAHYAQLKTDIDTVDRNSKEFEMLLKYVKSTHAETHKEYDLEIIDAFKVKRKGEERRYKPFKKLHNRKLLWHGSRLTNYVGILSHGLKIAPPEAPSTGYMFGKGIYFADMVSKSANYCCTSKSNTTGLMLLCEVALGDMFECTKAEYVTKLPKNKHSTIGIGKTQPNSKESFVRDDGVEVPYGSPVTDSKLKSQLLYNEYIVYDVAQVNVQYMLKMDFKYKGRR